MRVLALVLVIGAIFALTVGCQHRHKVDSLRQQFREQYGPIDVPEAMYFDGEAVKGGLTTMFCWVLLQLSSGLSFYRNREGAALLGKLAFGTLWLTSWLDVIAFLCFPDCIAGSFFNAWWH